MEPIEIHVRLSPDPLTRGMLFRGGPLLRGRAGWLFMPCGHTKKGRNTPPLFWVQYLN